MLVLPGCWSGNGALATQQCPDSARQIRLVALPNLLVYVLVLMDRRDRLYDDMMTRSRECVVDCRGSERIEGKRVGQIASFSLNETLRHLFKRVNVTL